MNGEANGSISNRTVYIDYLRVFATFAVMFLHISGQNFRISDVNGFTWQVFNFFDGIVRWAVPVFVMISGSLFLSRDVPIKKLYLKYILRLAVSYVVWSMIYACFESGSLLHRLSIAVKGHYHLWFIPMLIGLYMCIPVIKAIVKSDSLTKYYLGLALLFSFIIPELITLARDFGSGGVIVGANSVSKVISNMNLQLIACFPAYFILGYYMSKTDMSKHIRVLYLLGLAGFFCTVLLTRLASLKIQNSNTNYYGNSTLNVCLEAVFVFTCFKYRKKSGKLDALFKTLSKYSFGAYLVHALVIEQLNKCFGLNTLSFHPVLSVPCISALVFVISFGISAVLNRIPFVNKYMV